MATSTEPVEQVDLKRIRLGYMHVSCHACGELSEAVDMGTNPQMVGEELMLFGVVRFPACGHIAYCPHLARRCATVLERLEEGTLRPDDLCGLVETDHEPDPV